MKAFACVAALSAVVASSAMGQIQGVSRSSQLVSSDSDTPAWNFNNTYTTWASDSHTTGNCNEILTISSSVLDVRAGTSGYDFGSQPRHTGSGAYIGVFTFDLTSSVNYSIVGFVNIGFSSGAGMRLSDAANATIFAAGPMGIGETPFSNSGVLAAGRYTLRVSATANTAQSGSIGQSHVTFTVPTPAGVLTFVVPAMMVGRRRR